MGVGDSTEEFFKDGVWGWAATAWEKLVSSGGRLLTALYGWDGEAWVEVAINADGQFQVEVVGSAQPPDSITIANVPMTSADTEYLQHLTPDTKGFLIRCRGDYDIKVCFTEGVSGTTYITVPAGMSYWEDSVNLASETLYFQCATAGQVAEIIGKH